MKIRRFTLSEAFLAPYKEADPPWGPLGYITFKRTYARKMSEFGHDSDETEEWWHVCKRVIEGMFTLQKNHIVSFGLEWNDAKAQRTAKEAYDRLFTLKWTPPGRGLWMMGTRFAEEKTGAGLFNCAFRSTKDLATKGGYLFGWMMDALMLGVGVGFDTLGADAVTIKAPNRTEDVFQIPDSREGWVDSVVMVLNAFYYGNDLPQFDYSLIRPLGAPIKGFGGTACGPQPLIDLHNDLIQMHEKYIGKRTDSTLIVDTQNMIGRCVVAGNVRRSAALALGEHNDPVFVELKSPETMRELEAKMAEPGADIEALQEEMNNLPLVKYRWGSNNSINALVGMDYAHHANLTVTNGEPGYIWLNNARTRGRFKDGERLDDHLVMGFNPCVEQQLEDSELCCLVETYPAQHDSYEDYLRTLKIAYLYGKTITLVKTHWPETNQRMLKNRRIGLSQSGVIQAFEKFGRRKMYGWCDKAYDEVQAWDKLYSDWLCIPRSIRTTSIKPSGTVSLLNGSTPGIHFAESEYYIRRIRFAESSELVAHLREAGYNIEEAFGQKGTVVVEFPVKEALFQKSKAHVSMWEQLEIAAQYQYYWADNSVSVTVTFNDYEAAHVKDALQMYENRLKAVSFLRYSNTGYRQAPYEPITKEKYEEMISKVTPITKIETSSAGSGTKFCTNDSCEI
jgi:adenosylcobalamin-dependent ribonucleoside-triphosphate reductase